MSQAHLYRTVAELHIANINQGFLSTLGLGFVSLMYRAIDEGDDSVLLVARVNGQAVGFVAGATGMKPIYKRMLRHWPQLFWALLPSLFSPRRVWRIIEILRYSRGSGGTSGTVLPAAELLSIAVAPAFRGQHHAENLYQELCEHFLRHGLPAFKIVVGSALAPAHKFYRRMGAQPAAEIEVHQGSASTVYVQTLPWVP
ncbi:GNAT family N-acetyltransferase [Polaromonas glacialis]|uniref:GNAT family N-acetyltransferase n=1 Tax=Polaromonas glacialis TaxID=866564 RepID=UPI000497C3F1|nr:GNAT family N-acetyltransferase [Polaromonas glacialis]